MLPHLTAICSRFRHCPTASAAVPAPHQAGRQIAENCLGFHAVLESGPGVGSSYRALVSCALRYIAAQETQYISGTVLRQHFNWAPEVNVEQLSCVCDLWIGF